MSASDAAESIRSGETVFVSGGALTPLEIGNAMGDLVGQRTGIRVMTYLPLAASRLYTAPEGTDTFSMESIFYNGPLRKLDAAGMCSFIPANLRSAARDWCCETPEIDVMVLTVSPMDRHGYFMIPLCLIHEKTFLEAADRVILQVNPNLPRIYGDTEVHIRDVDMIVEAETPLPYLPVSTPNELEMTIGNYVASLVNDGDCIQLGIGGIPDAAALALKDKHDLGVHSEMITNSMVELVKQGVITGRKKNFMPGKIVGTFAYGTQALYDLLEENPGVRMLRGETVNDPQIVAQNDNFVSINACLSVDLTGQVCSESIGSRQYSGSGGQSDMAVGATHSKGGRNIIATASTKHGGTVSTITAQLEPGSIVTLSRNELDYVVTEYGIAPLRGRSVRQKVRNLIAVAHPDFRAALQAQAEKLMLW